MRITAVLILLLLCASTARAQSQTAFRASLVAAVAAHGADLAATENCIGAGRCTELNPFLLRFAQPGVFGAVKMGVAGLSLWATAKIYESHPTLAVWLNVAQCAGFSAIAIRNARVIR